MRVMLVLSPSARALASWGVFIRRIELWVLYWMAVSITEIQEESLATTENYVGLLESLKPDV